MRTTARLLHALLWASVLLTQGLAYVGNYAPQLGPSLVSVEAYYRVHQLYPPWRGYRWVWRWGMPAGTAVAPVLGASIGVFVLFAWGALRAGTRTAETPPPPTGYGTSRWGARHDLRAMQLRERQGIVLGRLGRTILRHNGPENVLVVMGQRQGKGTGIIIPTLLSAPQGHMVVVDIRPESPQGTLQQTAGYRSTFSKVLRLDLNSASSHAHNALLEIRKGTPREFGDAWMIADMLVDPASATDTKNHWGQTARTMLTAGVLYVLYREGQPSLRKVASLYSGAGDDLPTIMTAIRDDAPTPLVAEMAQEVLSKDLREASSVLSTTLTALNAWRNPLVDCNTRTSDFCFADFRDPDHLLTLYLVVSPADDLIIRAPLRVFLNQCLRRCTEDGGIAPAHLDVILDEFPFFGRLDFLAQHLSVLGGYGLRTTLAAQNIPQLTHLYGDADRLIEQCRVQVYGATQGHSTSTVLSQQTGMATVTTTQTSRHGGDAGFGAQRITRSEHQSGRPLLLPSDAPQVPESCVLLAKSGHPPLWAQKIRFWEHRAWRRRSRTPYTEGKTHA
jgi:type IV secretion system protein VirD4